MKTETREECVGFEHAPWCAGPSMRECAGGAEVAEDQPCPGNDTAALGEAPRGEAPEADPGSAEYEDARTPVPADPRIAPFYDSADLDDDGVGDVCAWTGLHPDAPLPPVPEDAVPLCGDVPARFPENPGPYVEPSVGNVGPPAPVTFDAHAVRGEGLNEAGGTPAVYADADTSTGTAAPAAVPGVDALAVTGPGDLVVLAALAVAALVTGWTGVRFGGGKRVRRG